MTTRRRIAPPLSKAERAELDDLIIQAARALPAGAGNRLLRLRQIEQDNRQQDRRTTGGLMSQVQQIGGQLKDMTVRAEQAEAKLAAVRAMHHDDYGVCAECTWSHGILWPCRTIQVLDGREVQR